MQSLRYLGLPRHAVEIDLEDITQHAPNQTKPQIVPQFVVTRKIVFKDSENLIECQKVVNNYSQCCSNLPGCAASEIIIAALGIVNINQVWGSMESLKTHMKTSEFLQFVKDCEKIKQSEEISIRKVTACN